MTAPTATLSDRLEELGRAATQGEWGLDTVQSEGEYGSGPNTHSGFHVSEIHGPDGQTLFDAINSDTCLVNEEFDDEGYCYAWDETSGHNAALIVALKNNLDTIIAALRERGE